METCPNCGNELPIIGGGAFCMRCGAQVRAWDASQDSATALASSWPSVTGDTDPATLAGAWPPVADDPFPSGQEGWAGVPDAPTTVGGFDRGSHVGSHGGSHRGSHRASHRGTSGGMNTDTHADFHGGMQDNQSHTAYLPPTSAEVGPHAVTEILPTVPGSAAPRPSYGLAGQPGQPGQPMHHPGGTGHGYSGPYDGGGPYGDEYDDAGGPRANVGVLIAFGVAAVAIMVVVASVFSLGGPGRTAAAQTPGATEVVIPTDTGSPTTDAAAVPTQASSPTDSTSSSSPSPSAPQAAQVVGVGSGRCMDIPGAVPNDGTQLDLFDCNGTAAQTWTYVNGTVQAMGKCLDVRGASSDDRTPVQVFACNGTAAQQWNYDPQSKELTTLGKCLDASGAGTGNQTPLILYSCHGGPNQQWQVAPAP